jgi:CHAT domain-containing protein
MKPGEPIGRRRVERRWRVAIGAIAFVAVYGGLGPTPSSLLAQDHAQEAKRLLDQAERLVSFELGRLEKLPEAVALFEQAAGFADRAGNAELGAQAWTRLGLGYWELKRYPDAESATQRGIALARAADRPATEAAGYRLLGNLFLRTVRADEARAAFAESLRAAKKSGDSDAVVRTLANMANLEMDWGHLGDAIAYARDAVAELDRALARGIAIAPGYLYVAPVNLGLALRDAGDYGEAGAYLERAFAAAQKTDNVAAQQRALRYTAEWYLAQGDTERAERFYRRVAERALAGEFQTRELEAHFLNDVAAPLALLRGKWAEAASLYAKGIALYETEGMRSSALLDLPRLGRALTSAGDRTAARTALDKAVAMAEAARWPRPLTAARRERARLHAADGRTRSAEDDYRRALDVSRAYGLRPDESAALAGLGQVAQSRGSLVDALARFEEAADVVETVRGRIFSSEQRATFAEAAHTIYASLFQTYMRLHHSEPAAGHDALALLAVERERAHDLRQALSAADAASRPAVRRGPETELVRRLTNVQARLQAPAIREAERRTLLQQLDDTERRLSMTMGQGRQADATAPREIARLRGVLDSEEAAVAYAGAGDRLYAFVVTRDDVKSMEVVNPAGLEARADVFVRLLAQGQTQNALSVGRALSSALMTPVLGALPKGTRRLLVSATGGLAGLPFGALPVEADKAPDGGAMMPAQGAVVPLLSAYEVIFIPSLGALQGLRESGRDGASRDLLAFGDPLGESGSVPAFTAELFEGARLGPLPDSRLEVEALGAALSGPRDVLQGDSASEAEFYRRPVHDYKVLHFATHAVLDARVPARSAVVLASGDGEDGLLQQREILGLGLSADLVVLSACRSAAGRPGRADGMQSLARAFLHAGARSVVGSLWDVDDLGTRRLVEGFYQALTRGASVGEALGTAQRAQFGADPWANGRDWAAFVAIGDPLARPRLTPAPSTLRADWRLAVAAGLVLVTFLLVRALGARTPRRAN